MNRYGKSIYHIGYIQNRWRIILSTTERDVSDYWLIAFLEQNHVLESFAGGEIDVLRFQYSTRRKYLQSGIQYVDDRRHIINPGVFK
jgi:hypothetical protein